MAPFNTKDLLLAPELNFQQITHLLKPFGFEDIKKADINLQMIAGEPRERELFAKILDEFLSALAQSPSPDQGLNHLERFTRVAFSKTHLFSYLRASPRTLQQLAKVLGSSPFLSEILIRDPEYFYWVFDPDLLKEVKRKGALTRELSSALSLLKTKQDQLDLLRRFKRKEILRIGIRDLLREASVEETLRSLTDLAEVLIQKAYQVCNNEMRRKYGVPLYRNAFGKKVRSGFTILAMGKLGGGEINFSSDVDLIYLYASASGESSGAPGGDKTSRLPNAEYFRRLSQEITSALSAMTDQGYVYRVDLRLRPEGEKGLIASPLQGYRRYYATRGETWERLSLIKVWPVAGDRSLGRRFLKMASRFIYERPFGIKELDEVRRLKDQIDEKISTLKQIHVKLGFGGIREIEFIVQSLQILGGKHAPLHERNTLKALRKLLRQHRLSREDYLHLNRAYLFLRDIENKLQMVNDLQTHLFPNDPKEVRRCALRLNYQDQGPASASEQLLNDYHFHTGSVHRIFRALFDPPYPFLLFPQSRQG